MTAVIVGLIIASYTVYLIYREIKNRKDGNMCGKCSGCASAKSCGQFTNSKNSH